MSGKVYTPDQPVSEMIDTLEKVADALDASVEIHFVPRKAALTRAARPRA